MHRTRSPWQRPGIMGVPDLRSLVDQSEHSLRSGRPSECGLRFYQRPQRLIAIKVAAMREKGTGRCMSLNDTGAAIGYDRRHGDTAEKINNRLRRSTRTPR